jgi:uncharacterized membrane protein YheB (UPF0754 family)
MIKVTFTPEDNTEAKILVNAPDMYSYIFSLNQTIKRHFKDDFTTKQSQEMLKQIQSELQEFIDKVED